MPNLKNQALLVADSDFQDRVRSARVQKAMAILDGSFDADSKADDARRYLAERVFEDPDYRLDVVLRLLATNGTVMGAYGDGGNSTQIADNDIEYVVGVTWDRVAGVTTA